MENDFTITRLTWHTKCKGNESLELTFTDTYMVLIKYLDTNGLLVDGKHACDLIMDDGDIVLNKSDLTGEGYEFIKDGYIKWMTYLDREGNSGKYNNVSVLERSLKRIRGMDKDKKE